MKDYGFLSFAKNVGNYIGKNISKNVSSKYSQKLLDYAKQSATDAFKISSEKAIQKAAEAPGDLIGNKTTDAVAESYAVAKSYDNDKIAETLRTVPSKQNSEFEKSIEIPRENTYHPESI